MKYDSVGAAAPPRAERRAVSIEQKLPLLISGLLLLVVAAYSTATYRAVRRSAIDAATQRIVVAVERLAQISEASTAQLQATMRDAAVSPGVRSYARLPLAGREVGALEAVRPLIPPAPAVAWVELWTADGRRILTTGSAVSPHPDLAAAELPQLAPRPDSVAFGPLRVRGDTVLNSTIVPVTDSGRVVGYLVRWGRIGVTPKSRAQIEDLVGADATLYYGHRPTRTVIDITGIPVTLPIDVRDPRTTLAFHRPREGRVLAARIPVRGTPWVLLASVPQRRVLARQDALFRRLAGIAVILIVAGAAGAWVVSRRLTQPLRAVTDAAEAVAAGDYSRRVDARRADELGRLAATFNLMSTRVEDSQRRLRAAMEAAEAGNRAKSQFLATMSHEIRTPLNAILGYTDLLRMEVAGPLTAQQAVFVERAQASCRHLTALISDVLDLSKIEADKMEVRREFASAATAIRAAVEIVQLQAQSRRITLEVACGAANASTAPRYRGDENRVKQVLVNLLSNAVKFTEPGGRITVGCGTTTYPDPDAELDGSGPWTFISVEDTGIGIQADRLAAIWEPFVQGDMGHTRSHGGTGLGLAISRRLARLLGGNVTARSEPGVGSVFFLWLPAAEAPADVTAVALPDSSHLVSAASAKA